MINNYELTDDQQNAFDDIKEWIDNSSEDFYTLSGFAGTGKTVLIDYITDYATEGKNFDDKLNVIVTATTNKAVKVLRQKVDHHNFSTIHSLLNIKPKKKGRYEIFEPINYNKSDITQYDLVIIDECSMISEKLLEIIENQILQGFTKVLFVGDPAQLQPVNETVSKCFEYSSSKLSKIVRHGDDIAQKSKVLRSTTDPIDLYSLVDEPSLIRVTVDDLKKYFQGFRDHPDDYRMLCWRNDQVDMWNFKLRVFDYGYIPKEDFNVGDIVIANTPCEVANSIVMLNSEEGEVLEVEEAVDDLGLSYYQLKVQRNFNNPVYLNVINKKYEGKLNKYLNNLADEAKKNKKLWRQFWATKKFYHDIKHCYAMTTHKSQGSGFKNVILDVEDYNMNRDIEERNQLAYVGVTRAQERVCLL